MAAARSFVLLALVTALVGGAGVAALRVSESRTTDEASPAPPHRVVVVPLDRFPTARARLLAAAAAEKLSVGVTVSRRVAPGAIVVRLTTRDLGHLALRRGRSAVISVARLDPAFQHLPRDPGLTLERLRKLVLREVSILALGRTASADPRSVLYGDARTAQDVDLMTEHAIPSYTPAWRRWIVRADRVCDDASEATLAIADRRVRVDETAFLEDTLPVYRRLVRRLVALPSPRHRLHPRFTAALRRSLAADVLAVEGLARSWSRAHLRAVLAESRRRSRVLQSLALRLGSAGCGGYFDAA